MLRGVLPVIFYVSAAFGVKIVEKYFPGFPGQYLDNYNSKNHFMKTDQVNIRYMVEDLDKAIEFYTKHLGFTIGTNASPAFADVTKGNLRLLLSARKSSAGRPMPDGTLPVPGGWNRIELVVDDLPSEVERLKNEGLHFRNDIVTGPGGSQILLVDPSGNLVELFESKK